MNAGLTPTVSGGAAHAGGSPAGVGRPQLNDSVFHTILATVLGPDANGSRSGVTGGAVRDGSERRPLDDEGAPGTAGAAQDGLAGAAVQSPAEPAAVEVAQEGAKGTGPAADSPDDVPGTGGVGSPGGSAAGGVGTGAGREHHLARPPSGVSIPGLPAGVGVGDSLQTDAILPPPHGATARTVGFGPGTVVGRGLGTPVESVGAPGAASVVALDRVGSTGVRPGEAPDEETGLLPGLLDGAGAGSRLERARAARTSQAASALNMEAAARGDSGEDEQLSIRRGARLLAAAESDTDDADMEADARSHRLSTETATAARSASAAEGRAAGSAAGRPEAPGAPAADASATVPTNASESASGQPGSAETQAAGADVTRAAPHGAQPAGDARSDVAAGAADHSGVHTTPDTRGAGQGAAGEPNGDATTADDQAQAVARPQASGEHVRSGAEQSGQAPRSAPARTHGAVGTGDSSARFDDQPAAGQAAAEADDVAQRRAADGSGPAGSGGAAPAGKHGGVTHVSHASRAGAERDDGHDSGSRGHADGGHYGGRVPGSTGDGGSGYPAFGTTAAGHGTVGLGSHGSGSLAGDGLGESVASQLRSPMHDIVAELVRSPARDGSAEQVSIRLRPEFLGEVVMRISVDGDGVVTARFIAEHALVRNMIEQQLPELRASLGQHGLQLGDASVSGGEAGLAWDNGPVPEEASGRTGQTPMYGVEPADEDMHDADRAAASPPTTGVIDIRV